MIRPSALGFLPDDHVLIAPNANPKGGFDAWLNGVIDLAKTEHIDTLVYIERVGPARDGSPHNMRGIDITEWTAPLSQLTLLGLHTIGVGDGGNEIGMGRVEDYAIEGGGRPRREHRLHGADRPAGGGRHVELGRARACLCDARVGSQCRRPVS